MALLAGWPAVARADELPRAVSEALQRAEVPPEALAALAQPLHLWGRRWSHAADRPMQPGSTMKIVTAVVAMDRLGPNHRGRTEVLSAAALVDGVLQGDLVLRGGADPELGWPQLWQLFDELRAQGVREIAGDIVLDRSLFRPERPDLGVPPFDSGYEFAYNVVPDALHLAGGLLGFELAADADTVRARTVPLIDGLEVQASMQPVAARCADWREHWQPALWHEREDRRTVIELRGRFPQGCIVRFDAQLLDRDRLAEAGLRHWWAKAGGKLAGRVRAGLAPPGARLLAQHRAKPWGEWLRTMNKQSDNTLTRLLYLQLGVPAMASEPLATTQDLAARAVRGWFAEQGIPAEGLVLDNGSGLSRSERITPRQLAAVIRAAWEGPHAPELLMSLPTVGVDGTMRNRLKDSPAAGWARLKTGTLRNVVALAGVLRDPSGRPWVLAAMINHERAHQARPALDALVDWLSRGQPEDAVPW